MPRKRRGRPVVMLWLLLGVAIAAGGCRTAGGGPSLGTPPMLGARSTIGPSGPTLAPQTVVRWSIAPPQSHSAAIIGRDAVNADGQLGLGPYGSVHVAGLTVEEARTAIGQYLAQQLPDARVNLQIEKPASSPRPLSRLLTQNKEPPLAAPPGTGWQYGKSPLGTTGKVAATSGSAAPSIGSWRTASARDQLAQRGTTDSRIRPVSATEQETAPMPNPLIPHAVGAPSDQPVPRELSQVSLPPYVIDPPDILLVASTQKLPDAPIQGQHLVRPDGTISLGIYGSVHIAGRTLDQARDVIARQLGVRIKDFDPQSLAVDVLAYNSKFYYIITDGAGYGEQVVRVPVTGYETVLDAISQINGLPAVASKQHIWVARRTPLDGSGHQVLPVDWVGITQKGSTATNYQVLPGDRIYVQSDHLIRLDNGLAKILNPIERVLGVTLLGSSVVNSIQGRNLGGTGGF